MSSTTNRPTSPDEIFTELTMTSEYQGSSNPELWDGREADKRTVRISYKGRTMTTPYYMGTGLKGAEPTVSDVLSNLFADAGLYDECGDDPDAWDDYLAETSIKVRLRTIKVIGRQASELRRLFGDDYDEASLINWEA